jgi:hypothetical protein
MILSFISGSHVVGMYEKQLVITSGDVEKISSKLHSFGL